MVESCSCPFKFKTFVVDGIWKVVLFLQVIWFSSKYINQNISYYRRDHSTIRDYSTILVHSRRAFDIELKMHIHKSVYNLFISTCICSTSLLFPPPLGDIHGYKKNIPVCFLNGWSLNWVLKFIFIIQKLLFPLPSHFHSVKHFLAFISRSN